MNDIIRVKDSDGTLFDALQYTGSNAAECIEFSNEPMTFNEDTLFFGPVEDGMVVDQGDWLVKELTDDGSDADMDMSIYTNETFESDFTIVTTEQGE